MEKMVSSLLASSQTERVCFDELGGGSFRILFLLDSLEMEREKPKIDDSWDIPELKTDKKEERRSRNFVIRCEEEKTTLAISYRSSQNSLFLFFAIPFLHNRL